MAISDDFKREFKAGNYAEALKIALTEAIELKITTCVVSDDASGIDPTRQDAGSDRMYTRINIIDGNIENEIGSHFLTGEPYSELCQFHLGQVQQGSHIINRNLQNLHTMFSTLTSVLTGQVVENAEFVNELTEAPTPPHLNGHPQPTSTDIGDLQSEFSEDQSPPDRSGSLDAAAAMPFMGAVIGHGEEIGVTLPEPETATPDEAASGAFAQEPGEQEPINEIDAGTAAEDLSAFADFPANLEDALETPAGMSEDFPADFGDLPPDEAHLAAQLESPTPEPPAFPAFLETPDLPSPDQSESMVAAAGSGDGQEMEMPEPEPFALPEEFPPTTSEITSEASPDVAPEFADQSVLGLEDFPEVFPEVTTESSPDSPEDSPFGLMPEPELQQGADGFTDELSDQDAEGFGIEPDMFSEAAFSEETFSDEDVFPDAALSETALSEEAPLEQAEVDAEFAMPDIDAFDLDSDNQGDSSTEGLTEAPAEPEFLDLELPEQSSENEAFGEAPFGEEAFGEAPFDLPFELATEETEPSETEASETGAFDQAFDSDAVTATSVTETADLEAFGELPDEFLAELDVPAELTEESLTDQAVQSEQADIPSTGAIADFPDMEAEAPDFATELPDWGSDLGEEFSDLSIGDSAEDDSADDFTLDTDQIPPEAEAPDLEADFSDLSADLPELTEEGLTEDLLTEEVTAEAPEPQLSSDLEFSDLGGSDLESSDLEVDLAADLPDLVAEFSELETEMSGETAEGGTEAGTDTGETETGETDITDITDFADPFADDVIQEQAEEEESADISLDFEEPFPFSNDESEEPTADLSDLQFEEEGSIEFPQSDQDLDNVLNELADTTPAEDLSGFPEEIETIFPDVDSEAALDQVMADLSFLEPLDNLPPSEATSEETPWWEAVPDAEEDTAEMPQAEAEGDASGQEFVPDPWADLDNPLTPEASGAEGAADPASLDMDVDMDSEDASDWLMEFDGPVSGIRFEEEPNSPEDVESSTTSESTISDSELPDLSGDLSERAIEDLFGGVEGEEEGTGDRPDADFDLDLDDLLGDIGYDDSPLDKASQGADNPFFDLSLSDDEKSDTDS
jgi:hypothetical protein